MPILLSISLLLLCTANYYAVSSSDLSSSMADTFAGMIFLIPAILVSTGWRAMIMAVQAINQGDHYRQKDLSTNPVDYLDPLGSLACFFFQFGWPTNPEYDTRFFNKPLRSEWRIYISGSLFNFWAALGAWILYVILHVYGTEIPAYIFKNIKQILMAMATMNLMIGIYSFLPLAPLPGYFLCAQHLPIKTRVRWDQQRSVGTLILMILLFVFNQQMQSIVLILLSLLGITSAFVIFGFLTLWIPFVDLRVHKLRRNSSE